MEPSKRIKDFIKGFEQCRLTSYLPTPFDKPTIGWGSTGPDIKLGMTWTQKQADERFERDLSTFAKGVAAPLYNAVTNQQQFDAMVSLAYNIGLGNFLHSSVLTNHKAGHFSTAALAFGLWNKQRQGDKLVVLKGLTKRRAAEAAIYKGE